MKTLVIFRKYKESPHDILALFPAEKGSNKPGSCMSYEHVGQHGSADYKYCIDITKPATPDEYKDLFNELRDQIGYNMKVIKRYTPGRRDCIA